jgi:hypothetical protein
MEGTVDAELRIGEDEEEEEEEEEEKGVITVSRACCRAKTSCMTLICDERVRRSSSGSKVTSSNMTMHPALAAPCSTLEREESGVDAPHETRVRKRPERAARDVIRSTLLEASRHSPSQSMVTEGGLDRSAGDVGDEESALRSSTCCFSRSGVSATLWHEDPRYSLPYATVTLCSAVSEMTLPCAVVGIASDPETGEGNDDGDDDDGPREETRSD